HAEELDTEISAAIGARSLAANLEIIESNKLTAQRIQTIADIEADPHWKYLGLTRDVGQGAHAVRMHTVIPHLSATPGEIRWPGGELGQHNEEIYCGELQMSRSDLDRLRASGVI
ncbi:MAG: formyl-CoA transferase, partial [Acidobacteria bacterium]